MTKRIYILLLCLIATSSLCVTKAYAAAITMDDLPYLCDFEDAAEDANWILNPDISSITTDNRWVIGDALSYTGAKSLYVSKDGGLTNSYAPTNNVLLAYRDITLEAGDYDVAYDWCGLGNKKKGYLKVVFVNRRTSSLTCLGGNVEPGWVADAVQLMGNNTTLIDGDSWRHVQARVSIPQAQANKTTTRLLFIWVNTDVTVKDSITSVAIDNFQLAKASTTDYPTNIHVATILNQTTITWEGNADSYEVLYRKKTDSEFTAVTTSSSSVTLNNLDYGAYELWICGINGTDKTIYTVFPTVFIYETDCFDALNMYNAEFEYGKWTRTSKTIEGTDRVDFGPKDIRSRQTTHFDMKEVDPRTVIRNSHGDTTFCLKTVPTGEFGSVRLGNWNTGSEYESMTFHYTVESSSMAVLLIRYAMVLENPDHVAVDQPRFTLDVFDQSGASVDTKCAKVDFHAPTSEEWNDPEVRAIWHHIDNYVDQNNQAHVIDWQDWKIIGISMEDYVGQTLTIKLTSYDCDQGGHFGYAYFTLRCSRSDVDGLPWGEGSSTQMFTAPEGFDYAWFNRKDVSFTDTIKNTNPTIYPYITEAGRYFYVQESDTNTYLCHVTYPTNKDCGYWFDASAKPHTPKAEMEYKWTPSNCRNGFTWWNRCHVVLTNQQTGEEEHRYDKQLENCYLILEDETEIPIQYPEEGTFVPMPDEGGTVKYGIRTGIYVNKQLFADTAWYTIEVPAIGPLTTNLYDTICRGDYIFFPEGSQQKYSDTGDYTNPLKSLVTGCDSTVIMHLFVHEPAIEELRDTMCVNSSYTFNGKTYTEPGKYIALLQSQVTHCDSMAILYLAQAPKPVVSLASAKVCADEPLIIVINDGSYTDQIVVRIGNAKEVIPVNHQPGQQNVQSSLQLTPGQRTAIVEITMPWCQTVLTDSLPFDVSFPNDIIALHWDDVLTFLSPEYNGGNYFTAYQWYRNNQPIAGATTSYYYEKNMNLNEEYTVLVTLPDGSKVWVCPFTPEQVRANDPQDINSVKAETQTACKILRNGQLVIIRNQHEYSAQGQLIK